MINLTKESTRRGLRSAVQVATALPLLIPVLLAELDFLPKNVYAHISALAATIVAACGVATKAYIALESRGLLPDWLHVAATQQEADDKALAKEVPAQPVVNTDPTEADGPQDVSQDPNIDYSEGPEIEDAA